MGETAIVVLVPEAEPLLGEYRRLHTEEGAHGMGVHVTLLYPFTDSSRLDGRRLADVREIVGGFAPFDFALAAALRFPENSRVLYLRPEPEGPFRALTAALVGAFPEHQPYGGKYADAIPHATVAIGEDAVLDPMASSLGGSLPIAARATEATLLELDDAGEWRPLERLPFRVPTRVRESPRPAWNTPVPLSLPPDMVGGPRPTVDRSLDWHLVMGRFDARLGPRFPLFPWPLHPPNRPRVSRADRPSLDLDTLWRKNASGAEALSPPSKFYAPSRATELAAQTEPAPLAESLAEQRRRVIDVAGADREQHVAGLRTFREMCGALLDRRHPCREHAAIRERVDDELAGDALDRLLARGVDVGHRDVVGRRERRAELPARWRVRE